MLPPFPMGIALCISCYCLLYRVQKGVSWTQNWVLRTDRACVKRVQLCGCFVCLLMCMHCLGGVGKLRLISILTKELRMETMYCNSCLLMSTILILSSDLPSVASRSGVIDSRLNAETQSQLW